MDLDPRDRGAWWAAVYGVAQSQTRLKRLSGSSSSPLHQPKATTNLLSSFVDLPVLDISDAQSCVACPL